MKLKNEALQKLYDKLAFDTLAFGISEQSQIDKAFIECDLELSDSVTFAQIKDLQDRCDIFEKSNGTLLSANLDLATKKRQLEKDLEYWKSRAKHAEEEVEDLKKKLEAIAKLAEMCDELQQKADDLKNELQAIRKDHGRLHEENRKSNTRIDCLRLEVEWYRKHYKEQYDKIRELEMQIEKLTSQGQTDKIEELKSRLNSMYGIKKLRDDAHDIGYKQGQTDLWDMLQNVNDAKPFELAACFPDVTCMDDILSWDLEDFLDAYKSWYEKKEQERIKHMRDYLVRFCMWRRCDGCPLHTDGFICGRGKGFCDMTYEELKKHYEKARVYNKRPWHGDATAEKIKFEPWSCTLEGTINVEFNRDLLNKVCGIDPDD